MKFRVALGLVLGALLCVLGALILGEYEFNGVTPIGAGLLFGLVISEVVIEIGATRHPVLGVLTGAMVAGALGWAAYVSSGEGLRPFPTEAWLAMVLGGVTAGWRTGRRRALPAGTVTASE